MREKDWSVSGIMSNIKFIYFETTTVVQIHNT